MVTLAVLKPRVVGVCRAVIPDHSSLDCHRNNKVIIFVKLKWELEVAEVSVIDNKIGHRYLEANLLV